MPVSIIVAVSENNAIGKNNQLLWRLPADLKHFKNITSGNTVIMGRKTFDSISKPLPNRRNIVISRQQNLKIKGVELANSLEQALSLCKSDCSIYIIGGAQIYLKALPFADKIYLTKVHQTFEADAYFPDIDERRWLETEKEYHQADRENAYNYTFSTLIRR